MFRPALLFAVALFPIVLTAAPAKPNIIVILVDDMGYSDPGCYGGEIATPNLDRLAKEGVRFTQFYNTARCCPSRAALLTGLYPHQAGIGHMTEERKGANGQPLPGYLGHLNDRCVTIAEALQPAGYFTAMSGKWHVGQDAGVTPWGRGFMRSLNSIAGGFYYPEDARAAIFLNGADLHKRDAPLPHEWYSTDLWTDYGLKFIDEAHTAQKPFFLYLAYNAPHFPLQAPADEIAQYRGKFREGWDKLRAARYQRQLEMGLIDRHWPLSPRQPEVAAWDTVKPEEQERFDHLMAIYAAVVGHMDKAVGRLVEGLRQRGVLDDTLILFMSDNGGNAESGPNGRLEGDEPGGARSTVFVGQSWATLNNTPFVRYKHFTDEGGIATPLIAHWPKGIDPARNGQFERQPGHLIDILPTCVDAAGAVYPKEFRGQPIQPREGTSLLPALAGKPLTRAQPLFWEHEGNRAVLEGHWKLVAVHKQAWRLYDVEADRTEQHDLATAQPERLTAMIAQWEAYAARTNVIMPEEARKAQATGSAEHSFTLLTGAHLDKAEAPAVGGRGFTITAKFTAAEPRGVLLAQGGRTAGYALFFENGKLTFAFRRNKVLVQIATPEALTGAHAVTAGLAADGTMRLAVDGGKPIEGHAGGLLKTSPTDGLDVGADKGGTVGEYTGANPFNGKIESMQLELAAE